MKCWIQPQKIRRTWLYPSSNLAISFQYLSCWWWGICGDLRSVRPSLIIEHHIDVSEQKHVHSCWTWRICRIVTEFPREPNIFQTKMKWSKLRPAKTNIGPACRRASAQSKSKSSKATQATTSGWSCKHTDKQIGIPNVPAMIQSWYNTISMPRIKIPCFHAFCSSSLKAIDDLYPQGQDPSTIDLASYHQWVVITITPSHHHSIIVSALPSSRFWWVLEPLTYFSGTAFAPGMNCIHLPTATSHPGSREQKWLNNTAAIKMDWTIKCPLLITRMNRIHPYINII